MLHIIFGMPVQIESVMYRMMFKYFARASITLDMSNMLHDTEVTSDIQHCVRVDMYRDTYRHAPRHR